MLSVIAFVLGGHFFTFPLGSDSYSFWEVARNVHQHPGDISWRFVFSIFYIWATALIVFSITVGWIAQAIIRVLGTALGRLIGPHGQKID